MGIVRTGLAYADVKTSDEQVSQEGSVQDAVESGATVGEEDAGVCEDQGEGVVGSIDGVVEGCEAAPFVADEDEVSEAELTDEDLEIVAVEVEGVDGGVVGLVGLTEADGVGGEAAESGGDEVGEEASVGVGGGAAAVEHDDVDGVVGAGVVVVHPVMVDDEEGVRVWEVLVGHLGGCGWERTGCGKGMFETCPYS